MALKKKKLYENQLEAVENNIMRVNEQQMMLENQRTTVETVAALSNAAKASKQTMHEMKIENVDKVWSTLLFPAASLTCLRQKTFRQPGALLLTAQWGQSGPSLMGALLCTVGEADRMH